MKSKNFIILNELKMGLFTFYGVDVRIYSIIFQCMTGNKRKKIS